MRFWLVLEEFSPELIYIKGSKNILADALSRLDKIDNLNKSSTDSNKNNNIAEPTLESLSENFALNKEDVLHPTTFKTIRINFELKLQRKSLKTIPLNYFMRQVRHILLSVKTVKLP